LIEKVIFSASGGRCQVQVKVGGATEGPLLNLANYFETRHFYFIFRGGGGLKY